MTLRLVRLTDYDENLSATVPSQPQPVRLPLFSPVPSLRSNVTVAHPVVAKVARLALLSEMGTALIDKLVTNMLDELE